MYLKTSVSKSYKPEVCAKHVFGKISKSILCERFLPFLDCSLQARPQNANDGSTFRSKVFGGYKLKQGFLTGDHWLSGGPRDIKQGATRSRFMNDN